MHHVGVTNEHKLYGKTDGCDGCTQWSFCRSPYEKPIARRIGGEGGSPSYSA